MSSTKSVRWGCWAAAGLAAGLLLLAGIGGGAAALYYWTRPPAQIRVEVQSPGTVRMNEEYALRIAVTNEGPEAVRIRELRLPQSVLEGAAVVDIHPASSGYLREDGALVCHFDQPVDPASTVVFSVLLRALRDGEIAGPVEVVAADGRGGTDLFLTVSSATSTPARLPTATLAAAGAADRLRPVDAVVMIVAMVRTESNRVVPGWGGSGTILTPDGYILTNYHVAVGSNAEYPVESLQVYLTQDPAKAPSLRYYAEVVEAERELDLAVIRIIEDKSHDAVDASALNLPWIPVGDADLLNIGDPLVILGYPMIGGNTVTITEGIVSGFTEKRSWIKTDASISGGNSGGVALNTRGELVGIPTQLGSGSGSPITDCRSGIADTNGDGRLTEDDSCVPAGGFINAIRPVNLAFSLIEESVDGWKDPAGQTGTPESPAGRLIFWDDFSDPFSGWAGDPAGQPVSYRDGYLALQAATEGVRVLARPRIWLRDSTADVRVASWSGGPESGFGAVCRYRGAEDYYFFRLDGLGRAVIGKMEGGALSALAKAQADDWIRDGGTPFTLRAVCAGEDFSFYIDGTLAVTASDDAFATGDLAVFVEASGNGPAEILLDELLVYNP